MPGPGRTDGLRGHVALHHATTMLEYTYEGVLLWDRMRSVAAAVRGRCLFVEVTGPPRTGAVHACIRRAGGLRADADMRRFPYVLVSPTIKTRPIWTEWCPFPHNLRPGTSAMRALEVALAREFGCDWRPDHERCFSVRMRGAGYGPEEP